ncbi:MULTISPECIES: SDR family NAD(P)-dependent oxidoreductase [Mycolicibacterium]|jgi:short-subunit dehydrogenase|uniref:Short-chain dehydrogenase/reductase SDR n=1 Tax=Mycolicibacterium vanbaalenii (strain DSM 7251 / JCM 13017 / BCRC 16820 / KCTC 9966 / NRRL B-24157 / PYR-1) TaxID=350058 RepID=A1T9R5_MYCVP|nr:MULTISPECIES: SDR family oxidoreductase [Mycolicibacterium]ABM13915.1 short-chain dehydrogenase/reductase SDR [Mycolicibacterium vanbaalenii PYR-1]MCV7129049.1 SDR family oxidoreductase [Mycolicibacterium vanbaalenii PYR-1]MDW5609939.1 SDR family oxidoreductase [Mycolicibacterium sp. D5.8-2]QZT54460.1 SDR family oxidoreductase [Mycolicibacterium austroafricanum]QZY43821.1 SDR family oxidoreductase [Mycolicibacterium austroafricanum]
MSLAKPSAGTTVVITGASSGIGEHIARGLARRGYSLTLIARRRDRLEALSDELCRARSISVDVVALDLNEQSARAEAVERLRSGAVAGLVNSAGFGTNGLLQDLPPDRERDQVIVNVLALTELTHAVLPQMVERGAGAVLNIGSIAGFQPLPGAAVYSATKAYVQTFSEAVHEGLHGTGVSCTALCPGPVPTEWWEIAGEKPPGGKVAVSVEEVAEAGIAAMREGKRLVVPGLVPKLTGLGGRFTPRALLLPALRMAAARRR